MVLLLGGVEGLVVGDVGDKGGEAETKAGEQVPEPDSLRIIAREAGGQEGSQFQTSPTPRMAIPGRVRVPALMLWRRRE